MQVRTMLFCGSLPVHLKQVRHRKIIRMRGFASAMVRGSAEKSAAASHSKLKPHSIDDCLNIIAAKSPNASKQPHHADGGYLVGHGLPPPTTDRDVSGIVADHHGRSRLLHFAADRWVEADQPDLAAQGRSTFRHDASVRRLRP
jgi:hypothetical protein